MFDHKEYIASLPRRPGVYRMYGAAEELLYVGKARSLKDRVATYFAPRNVDPKVQALVAQISAIEVTVTNSETEALLLEYNLIKEHKPRFNIVLRDDKSFPYIHVYIEHDYPRLEFYRGSRAAYPFGHGREHALDAARWLIDSYHCSRYNTATRRLTAEMFRAVVARVCERAALAAR